MPRTIQQVRFNWLVPERTLENLQRLAESEEVAAAELIRRIGDILLTFDITAKLVAPGMQTDDTIRRFTAYISPWMLEKLTMVSLAKSLTVHEYLRQGSEIYLKFKASPSYGARLDMLQRLDDSGSPLTHTVQLV